MLQRYYKVQTRSTVRVSSDPTDLEGETVGLVDVVVAVLAFAAEMVEAVRAVTINIMQAKIFNAADRIRSFVIIVIALAIVGTSVMNSEHRRYVEGISAGTDDHTEDAAVISDVQVLLVEIAGIMAVQIRTCHVVKCQILQVIKYRETKVISFIILR